MNYKIAPIILTPRKKTGTTGDIFIAQPDFVKESLVGKLFIVLEIETKKISGLKIMSFLINNINRNYYQNEKIMLMERVASLTVEHIFETALAKTNKDFVEFLRKEKIHFPPINISVGVIYKNKIYFTNFGKNKILLIHKSVERKKMPNARTASGPVGRPRQKPIGREYKISDIAQQTNLAEKNKQNNNIKLFSDVISGRIPEGGHFIIVNEALPEYVSPKQLVKIVTTLPAVGAVEQIKLILSRINAYVSFWGVIIKGAEVKEREKLQEVKQGPAADDSIVGLNKTEEATANLLAPSGVVNFKKWMQFLVTSLSRKQQKQPSGGHGVIMLKDKIIMKKNSSTITVKAVAAVKIIFIYLINLLTYIVKIITSKKNAAGALAGFSLKMRRLRIYFSSGLTEIRKLNKKNKILLILSVSFLLLFISNISIIKIKNTRIKRRQEYQNLTALIEKKQNQAEADLLYSNEDGAQKLFAEIKNLIEKLPRNTDEQIKRLSQFKNRLDLQLEKVRHIIRVDNPLELADFSTLNSSAAVENISFIPEIRKICAADSAQKSIYIMDIASNLITTVADLKKRITGLKFPAAGSNNIVYYLNGGNIIAFDASEEKMDSLALKLNDNNRITAADTYNNRLYLLDSGNKQIYRYGKSTDGFIYPHAWMRDNINLEQAVDMSIDGYIYILKNTGEVLKFLRGKQVDFTLSSVDPPLEAPTKLFVSLQDKFIYILEPKRQRCVVFDKTGRFLLQYQAKNFTDIKDFAVDEKNKIIYFLNNTSVYAFAAKHFEE